jgi:hypothetical protein
MDVSPATAEPNAPAEAAPFEAREIARWCFVANAADWGIDCELDVTNGPAWVPVDCHWEIDWTTVPWDTMPTSTRREGHAPGVPIAASEVVALPTCALGITPPSEAARFFALPKTASAPTPSVDVKPDAPTPDAPPLDEPTPHAPTPDAPPLEAATRDAPAPDAPPHEGATRDAATPDAPPQGASTPDGPTPDVPPQDAPTPNAPSVTALSPIRAKASPPSSSADAVWPPELALRFDRFADHYLKSTDRGSPHAIDFDGVWRFDANGDGKDEWLGLYTGSLVTDGDEGNSPHSMITEGIVWVDGRRPSHILDRNINEASDHTDGLAACGLVLDEREALMSVVLRDETTFRCGGTEDSLVLVPLDPTRDTGSRSKPLAIDPRPTAWVRDPSAAPFNRRFDTLDSMLGFRPGMTITEVAQVLDSGRAPRLGTVAAPTDGSWRLASGPTFRFDPNGRLTGLTIGSSTIAEALRSRGFDAPLLDILGQAATPIARAIAGRRPDTFVFDGAVSKDLGVTLALTLDEARRVSSVDIDWFRRRSHLGANATFMGPRLDGKLQRLPAPLAKNATTTPNGWAVAAAGIALVTAPDEVGDDGAARLVSISASATPTPPTWLVKEPLLGKVGQSVDALTKALGTPDLGQAGATEGTLVWYAPGPHRPAWALSATVAAGLVTRVSVETSTRVAAPLPR